MLRIEEISGRRQLKQFVQFAIDLYKCNDCYVPPIITWEVDALDDKKNPAFDFCEAKYFMAFDGDKPVGRIAGFINHSVNEKFHERQCRFSFVDFVDDDKVSRLLLDAICEWGKSKGMETIVGPLGLTDMDYEGCLIEGFDQLSTSATIYNAPYYARHFEAYGMAQDAEWCEFRMDIEHIEVPEKHLRIANIVKQRLGLRVFKDMDTKHIVKHWGHKIFHLLNEAYAPLYGFTALTDRQIDYYINLYLPQVRLELVRLVADKDDNLVAFGICVPSLSRAQQKAKGKMFPFGWWHLYNAMYRKGGTDTLDLLLVGVRPDLQGMGVNALLFTELIPEAAKAGFHYVETNPELASNQKVQSQWQYFNPRCHKRRVTFKKSI